jgi:ribosome-binding protein aMBF1 (putative translation factor)
MATRRTTHQAVEPDALDEMITEYSQANPEFPQLLAAAENRRRLLRALSEERRTQNVSQTTVAAAMGTSQSALARLETSATDAKLSTVERLAAALGYSVEYRLVRRADRDIVASPSVKRTRRGAKSAAGR